MTAETNVTTFPETPAQDRPHDGSGAMFDRIAPRYDLLNRIISLGIDRGWRRCTARALEVSAGQRVLDIATGTADLALEVARHTGADVIGVDPSEAMLQIGRRKVETANLASRVQLHAGSGEELRFDDGSFDAACMAFGIRNIPDRPAALRELRRVVRPGGRIAILELSEPGSGLLASLARFHVHTVVPWLGALLSGAHEYRYLQRSIATFPPPEEFAAMLSRAGLDPVPPHALTFGAVHLYVATRPE